MLDAFAGNRELLDSRRRGSIRSGAAAARSWRNWNATSRRSCDCSICGVSSARRSRAPRSKPDEDTQLENERAGAAERPKAAGERGDGIRCVYESPGIGGDAELALRSKRVDELYRIDSTLEGLRETSEVGGFELAGSGVRAARLSVRDWRRIRDGLEEVENRLEAIDAAEAQVRAIDGGDPERFWTKCGRQIAGVESAGERMEALRKRAEASGRRSSKSWRAELTEARRVGCAPPGEAGRGGTGATGDGAYGVPAWR